MTTNYKGDLQEHCLQRGLGIPLYATNSVGPPNEPSWIVTLKWGKQEHTTPSPIPGSKRVAEQEAAKQVLAEIKTQQVSKEKEREEHLAQNLGNMLGKALSDGGVDIEEALPDESITVPIELVTHAVGIANFRYNEKKRDERNRLNRPPTTESDDAYVKQVAELTMKLVRALQDSAKRYKVEMQR